ncbi:uncharacterized protein LOC142555105 isoform X2 [Primulina tabacum]|uniref:uncharacterized protein LOC142555105 isoform X2 n=1 Tax=Primulina tabacum TaxID=48773 RepID=UPI003F5A576F
MEGIWVQIMGTLGSVDLESGAAQPRRECGGRSLNNEFFCLSICSVLEQIEVLRSMAFNGSGCSRSTSGTAEPERGLKKTPWTLSEDNILREYVKKHGEGNWGSIQEISGLDKSGKSCRNRWANYLRPNLKKGAFSAEEEKLIIELHGEHGNKWAHIAAQLQGRTDNEVKNYWNMRLKKCQRSGLAIYPQEMSRLNQPLNSSPSPAFSSHLASFQPQDPNLLCLSNSIVSPSPNDPLPNMLDKSCSANYLTFARESNGGMALSLMVSDASNELFSSPTLVTVPSVNQILPNSLLALPVQENFLNFGFNPDPNKWVLGLPAMQSPGMVTLTLEPFSSDNVIATPNSSAGDFEVMKSEFLQGPENKDSRDDFRFLNEELSKLLDVPLSAPIPEWDDLDPRTF